MSLISVVIILVAIGVILWLIDKYAPMDAQIKRILQVVVIIVVVLWLLGLFGILPDLSALRVGR